MNPQRSHWPTSIALGLVALLALFGVYSRAVASDAAPAAEYAIIPTATPSIDRILPAIEPAQAPVIVGYWAPGGDAAGSVALVAPVLLVERYQGWGRFRTAHMASDLWAPLGDLSPALDAAALAAAPEIAPTAVPYVPASAPVHAANAPPVPADAPVYPAVYLSVPAAQPHAPPEPVLLEPVANDEGPMVKYTAQEFREPGRPNKQRP